MPIDSSTSPISVNGRAQPPAIDPNFIKQSGTSGIGQSTQIGRLYHPDYLYVYIGPAVRGRAMRKTTPRTAHVPSVEVTKVGKIASTLVLCICALSLLLWLALGVFFITPLISIAGMLFSILFLILSIWCEKIWKTP